MAPGSLDPNYAQHGRDERDQRRGPPQIPRSWQRIDRLHQEFLPALQIGDVSSEPINLPQR
jgi:hypothetical protein